jgi:hypothetical protein
MGEAIASVFCRELPLSVRHNLINATSDRAVKLVFFNLFVATYSRLVDQLKLETAFDFIMS